jgi:hypothetical protein
MLEKRLLLRREVLWLKEHAEQKDGKLRCKKTGAVIMCGEVSREVSYVDPDLPHEMQAYSVTVTYVACPKCPLPTSAAALQTAYLVEDDLEED